MKTAKTTNMEANVYNNKGKAVSKVTLPTKVFGANWNADLVHQVVVVSEANARTPIAHAKDRSEVSGGGKKPWKQKGTGRARHGSIRSPIWVGGGVAHGPRNTKVYARKTNKKMKNVALASVLSAKFSAGEIFFIDSLNFKDGKTKEAKDLLTTLAEAFSAKEFGYSKGKRVLIATDKRDATLERGFKNIVITKVDEARNIDARLALLYKYIVFVSPEDVIKVLEARI